MSNFIEKVKKICEENEKVAMYIDMDGTIVEYHIYESNEIAEKMGKEYKEFEPLKCVIQNLKELSNIKNLDMYILSLSKTNKITEEKKNWLKKYVPFIKEDNWIILTKEIGDYSSQNRDIIKGENIKKREENYTHSILLDDEQKVLREAKRLLKEKCTIYHVSSTII